MRSIQLFAVPLALAFCVSTSYAQETDTKTDFTKVAKMLHGEWAGDAEMTAEEIKKMDDENVEAMKDMILEQVGSMEVIFKDGTYDVAMAGMELAGTWKVTDAAKKDDTQVVNIHTVPEEGTQGEEKNFEIHFVGDKHIKMIDSDGGPPIVLARKEKEKD